MNQKKIIVELRKYWFYLIYLLGGIVFLATSPGKAYAVKLLFWILMAVCVRQLLQMYCQNIKDDGTLNKFFQFKDFYIICFFGILVFLPILSTSYYFQDEYWNYPGYLTDSEVIWSYGRIFQSLFVILFSFVTPQNNYLGRWFTVFWAILLTFFLYNWLWKESHNRWFSLLTSMAICYSSVMADCVGYLSINSFIFGVLLVCISTTLFEKAFITYSSSKKAFIKYLLLSIICLYSSIHSYQLALVMVFPLYAIKVWYSQDRGKIVTQFFSNMFMIISVVGVYYVSIILMNSANGTALNSRALVIDGLSQLSQKIQWFFLQVLPAAVDRIIAAILGKSIINSKNYWYYLTYLPDISLRAIWLLRGIFFLMVFGIILIYLIRTHKLLETLFMLLAVPASYGIYLLLQEDGYLTYYAFPLISLLVFYICMFMYEVMKLIFRKRRNIVRYMGIAIICWIGIQTYIYSNDFWVKTNKESYDFLYHSLETKLINSTDEEDIQWIHVYGTPSSGQNTAYSIFAVDLICRELGINCTDYRITSTNNFYYSLVMPAQDMKIAEERLSSQEIERLKEFYSYDQAYGQYSWNGTASENELKEIRGLFVKADLIPDESDHALIVDLTWVKSAWK